MPLTAGIGASHAQRPGLAVAGVDAGPDLVEVQTPTAVAVDGGAADPGVQVAGPALVDVDAVVEDDDVLTRGAARRGVGARHGVGGTVAGEDGP